MTLSPTKDANMTPSRRQRDATTTALDTVTSPFVSVALCYPAVGSSAGPVFTGSHDARRSPLQPQVAARLAMGIVFDSWNYHP